MSILKRGTSVRIVVIAAVTILGGLGVAVARPLWVPAWARLPALSRLVRFDSPSASGKAEAEDAGLFCREHRVPEKFCTLCHEELNKSLMLCKEHGGIPEDICTLCHPEVEAKYGLVMCEEHGLPEAFCVSCGHGPSASTSNPALTPPDDGWCAAHNLPESLCSTCIEAGDDPAACRQPLPIVRLASANLADRINLETAEVRSERHAHHLAANAETAYDGNRFAEVYPRVRGYLSDVRVDLGDRVERGDVLAVVDSAEVGSARSRYLSTRAALDLARTNFERTTRLAQRGAVAAKEELEALTTLNQAEAALMDAEQTLFNLNIHESELADLKETRDTSNTLEIVSPIEGTIVNRHAVQGEAVEPTTRLFAVADTATMWLWIDVYEADIDDVSTGQPVRFSVSDSKAPVAEGRVTWVGTEVDPTTRTTRVRAELANPDGRLRANQFGLARLTVGDEHDAVLVPESAVQRNDGASVVFLPDGPGRFRPQRILTRPSGLPEVVEVSWGLDPGQRVVTRGSYLLKTEIMRGAIGAGCCE